MSVRLRWRGLHVALVVALGLAGVGAWPNLVARTSPVDHLLAADIPPPSSAAPGVPGHPLSTYVE
ncbi:MAG: hypothetical protein HYY05_05900, partial [Chloroflexi bacterium]|nr:hypothetical protein [Chloroflexota bacterium]